MGRYDSLPVYKAVYDLLQSVYRHTDSVPRDVKFTLVEQLKNSLTELLVLIYRTNASSDKSPLIADMRERMTGIKIRLRLLHDLRHIGVRAYARLVEQGETISKQLAAWHKYVSDRAGKAEDGRTVL